MIIENLYKLADTEEKKETLVYGLVGGLVGGLVFGLVCGLVYSINFFAFLGLASLILHYPNFIPLWILIIAGIIILEVLFWLDSQKKPKKFSSFWFTVLKKGEALLETVAVFGYLNLARLGFKKLGLINWSGILKWTGYIVYGTLVLIIVLGVIYLYIKLNSLKYKK